MTVKTIIKYLLLCNLCIVLCMAPSPAKCAQEKNIQNVYFQALQDIENGNFLKGVQLYYRFLLVGDLALSKAVRAHDLDKAISHFEAELAGKKQVDKASLAIVLIDRILERLDIADKRLNALREKFPSSALLVFIKGELLLTMGQQNQAMQIFETMNRLPNPRGFPALVDDLLLHRGVGKTPDPVVRREFLLRIAYRRWDEMDFDGAIKMFRNVMNEFPEEPEAPRALVDLLIQIEKPDEAVQIVDAWPGSSTEPLIAPLPLARIRYSQERFEEVVGLIRPLLQTDPQDMYLRLMMAESLFQIGQYTAAASLYEELSRADRKNLGFLQRSIVCLDAADRVADVLPRLEAYVKENPKDLTMRVELASILLRLKKFDDACVQYYSLCEVENPYRELAFEKIALIDKLKYAGLFNTDTANAEGTVSATSSFPEGTSNVSPEPSPVNGGQNPTKSVDKTEQEQIQRIKELFK
ncbi:MAG: tetratricopeptide repeat protein [Candidatus Ozemobacteraceae bacterium]